MKKLLLVMLSMLVTFSYAAIVTPYPTTFTLKQINSAEKERVRMVQGQKKYERQPTGFYVESGKKIVVDVEILTPATDNTMPVLTVGTLGFNPGDRNTGVSTTLKAGLNTITNHQGGLIWLSFVENGVADPVGVAQITFTEASLQDRAPYYVYGTTTDKEFNEMLTNYKTADVLFVSDYVAVVATHEAARQYSNFNTNTTKLKEWMDAIHTLLDEEDKISGMDNDDPNPVHHRLKLGEVRFLLTENTSGNPHASSAGYTGYPYASRSRYLTKIGTSGNNTWMLGHEIGHQHQQPAYQIDKSTESTVNIYSYVVERNIVGPTYNRTTAQRWAEAQNTYLSLPIAKRIYNMDDTELATLVGFNRDELRFMMWEHLFLIFGDQFYKTLHRIAREEKVISGTDDDRKAYLIWKSSQITGYDLTEFFNGWGVRVGVSNKAVKEKLRARIAYALSTGAIEPLPVTVEQMLAVTGQNRPSWTPLPLKGISSVQVSSELARNEWTIITSHEGVPDPAVGGNLPNYMIDGDNITAFSFIKPGEKVEEVEGPADYIPSLTIDMKKPEKFNVITYRHRTGNSSELIRARQFSILGSTDGEEFTPIMESYKVNVAANADELEIFVPVTTCRYVKIVFEDWNKTGGKTFQISEIRIGTKEQEVLPTPDPVKFKVDVELADGIVSTQAGVNMVNEDDVFVLSYSIGDESILETKLLVDGDEKKPKLSANEYSYSFRVTNHTEIKVLAVTKTGILTQNKALNLELYPNPVRAGQPFTLKIQDDLLQGRLQIFTLAGEKILDTTIENNQVLNTIREKGIYFLSLQKDNFVGVQKLIVQ